MYLTSIETLKQIKLTQQPALAAIDKDAAWLEIVNGSSQKVSINCSKLAAWAALADKHKPVFLSLTDNGVKLTSESSVIEFYSQGTFEELEDRGLEPIRLLVTDDELQFATSPNVESIKQERKQAGLAKRRETLRSKITKLKFKITYLKRDFETDKQRYMESCEYLASHDLTEGVSRARVLRETKRIDRYVKTCLGKNVMALCDLYWISEDAVFNAKIEAYALARGRELAYTPRRPGSNAAYNRRKALTQQTNKARSEVYYRGQALNDRFLKSEYGYDGKEKTYQDYRRVIRKWPRIKAEFLNQLESLELELKDLEARLETLT